MTSIVVAVKQRKNNFSVTVSAGRKGNEKYIGTLIADDEETRDAIVERLSEGTASVKPT